VDITTAMSRLDDLFAEYPARLSVSQVSEILGIGRATTYTWLNEGKIPGFKVHGAWVILRDELKDLIASGRNLSPPRDEHLEPAEEEPP
jgi:excisionase family DNA binding protein